MREVIPGIIAAIIIVFILLVPVIGIAMLVKYVLPTDEQIEATRQTDRDRKIQFCYDRGGVANLGADLEFKGCYGVMGKN